MRSEATVTRKGQIKIPKEIRDSLHMKEGDRFSFTLLSNGTVLIRVKYRSALEIAGRLHKRARQASPVEDLSR
jgi:AbrB family looped-hinge helix DNA binding protein